jgi:hypothetical protein
MLGYWLYSVPVPWIIHQRHRSDQRQPQPQPAPVLIAPAEPRRIHARKAQPPELHHPRQPAGPPTQHRRRYLQVLAKLHKLCERTRKRPLQPLRLQHLIGPFGLYPPIRKAKRRLPVDIVIPRTYHAVLRPQPGSRKQRLLQPLLQLRISRRPPLPREIARYRHDLRPPLRPHLPDLPHQGTECQRPQLPRRLVFVLPKTQIG